MDPNDAPVTIEEIKEIEQYRQDYKTTYGSIWTMIYSIYNTVERWYYKHTIPYIFASESADEGIGGRYICFGKVIRSKDYLDKFLEETEQPVFNKENPPEWVVYEILYHYGFPEFQKAFPSYLWERLNKAKEWLLDFHKLKDGDREDFLVHILTGAHLLHSEGRIIDAYDENIITYDVDRVCNEGLRSVFSEEEINRFLSGKN